MTLSTVPASALAVKPGGQDRERFDASELDALAASIAAQGILQVPRVRPAGDGYEIIFGERRIRAMRDVLGWDDIPVDIVETSDEGAAWAMLIENVLRSDLDPMAEARAYQERMERFDATPARIAAECGVSPARIRDRLKLLALTDHVSHWVETRQLPIRHALLMCRLDGNRQALALAAYQAHAPAVDAFGALCARLADEQAAEAAEGMFSADSFLRVEEYVREAEELVRVEPAPVVVVRERVISFDEIATDYAVSRAQVRAWCRSERFPAPDLTVGGQAAWYEETITTWATDLGIAKRAAMF